MPLSVAHRIVTPVSYGSLLKMQTIRLYLRSPERETLFLKFIYLLLFLAELGLHCLTETFSGCSVWGLLFVAVGRLLMAAASLVAEHRL